MCRHATDGFRIKAQSPRFSIPMAHDLKTQVSRYSLVGILNTLATLLVIYGLKAGFGADDYWANAAGYGGGLIMSFHLNRAYTFGHDGAVSGAAVRFLVAFAICYAINLAVVVVLVDGLGVNGYLAQSCGMASFTISFYILLRMQVFRRTAPSEMPPR
jgi:putative flippase GtrA